MGKGSDCSQKRQSGVDCASSSVKGPDLLGDGPDPWVQKEREHEESPDLLDDSPDYSQKSNFETFCAYVSVKGPDCQLKVRISQLVVKQSVLEMVRTVGKRSGPLNI